MIILGVDPGSIHTGFGAIQTDGRCHALLEHGVLSPPTGFSLAERIRFLHAGISAAITRLSPDMLAVEDVFHAVNARSALILGHVRGAILLAGAQAGLEIAAFPPATVKQQLTGYGRAEKTQVALMVWRLLALKEDEPAGDATDALAVALCGALRGLQERRLAK